ncbi:hypothetical protein D3C75_1145540 [compost metagenome]
MLGEVAAVSSDPSPGVMIVPGTLIGSFTSSSGGGSTTAALVAIALGADSLPATSTAVT